jgi:hypothetical protein
MQTTHIARPSAVLHRRSFLKGLGISLALPALECMHPVFGQVREPAVPRRMLLISNNLGLLPKQFFPSDTGRDYTLTPYLEKIAPFRSDFTVFSGLSHPGVVGGHSTENCFLTGARGPSKSGFRNQISLDQFAAEKIGQVTRFRSLNLGVNISRANRSLSWTRDGAMLPAEDSAGAVFRKMFIQGSTEEISRRLHRLEQRGSILDTLQNQAKRFTQSLGTDDRSRMDQYLTSIREVEERLAAVRDWESRPKPAAPSAEPDGVSENRFFIQKLELMLRMARLAFESDSTRIISLMVDGYATGVFQLREDQTTTEAYHGLSHHGQAAEKVRQLADAESRQMELLGALLGELGRHEEAGQRLLDRTMVLYGSNLGDANTHDNSNLPILLAGGGFKHGQHLAFPKDANAPLCNLFVSLLHRFGIHADAFGSSTGPLRGLNLA